MKEDDSSSSSGGGGSDRERSLELRHQSVSTSISPPSDASSLAAAAAAEEAADARKKKWAPKVRTGCTTCRIRRIKCDEGKPECYNCVRSAKACRGTGYSDMRAAPLENNQPSMSLAPSKVKMNHQDLQAFHILRQKTMGQISGMFDRAFWTVDVLRASHVYPAIWHACLAISAMHERMALPNTTKQDRETRQSRHSFALGQYNTSIQHIVKIAAKPQLSDSDHETIVLASTLFTGICCMEGDLSQAIKHARNGLGVFYQWQRERPSGRRGDYRTGRVMSSDALTTLTSHVSLQVVDHSCNVDDPPPAVPAEMIQGSAMPFMSANAAYLELVPIASTLQELSLDRQLTGTPAYATGKEDQVAVSLRESYEAALATWEEKFQEFLARHEPAEDETHCILMLRLIWTAMQVITHEPSCETPDLPREEFEKFYPIFERFVDLAEQLFDAVDTSQENGSPVFSFSVAVCRFVFHMGRFSRNSELRRRLVAVLRKYPRRDGVWDSELVAVVMDQIIELEERNTAEAVSSQCGCECKVGVFACDAHRIAGVNAEYPASGVTRVELRTQRDIDEDRQGQVMELVWNRKESMVAQTQGYSGLNAETTAAFVQN